MNAALVALGLMLAAQNPTWSLPATIEALRDVDSSPSSLKREQRGVLYTAEAFHIRKGERFQMIKINGEGGCRIRFKSREHDLTSCHWLEGFGDHEADVYRVVSGHPSQSVPKKR